MNKHLYRKTPLMGWASWNAFRTNISEELMKKQMDVLVNSGLAECGYIYANMDDGFFGGRDENGQLKFHKERFPNGIKCIADYAHSKGLKAGIYSEGGDKTCGYYYDQELENGCDVGLYGHEEEDLNLYLDEFGFDFIKIDWCGGVRLGLDEETQYTKIANIIDNIRHRTNRQLVFNICRWQFPGAWAAKIADSWRTGCDITPQFDSVIHQIDNIKPLARYCSPGHVNDLDMMQIGNGLDLIEEKTHFTMWCMMSTPLMIGCDLTKLSEGTLKILKNKELIAINQDSACLQAYPIKSVYDESGNLVGEVWIKDLGQRTSNAKAIVFLNRSNQEVTFEFSWNEAGLTGEILHIRELWEGLDYPCSEGIHLTVGPKNVAAFKVISETAAEVVNVWDKGEILPKPLVTINYEEAKKLITEGAVLIDVRDEELFERSHLKGAINLPYYGIHDCAKDILKDKNQPIIVYCTTGKRSNQAKLSLECLLYKNIYCLMGVEEYL